MDALEQVVRDVQTAFNVLNVGQPALTFAFGGREREEAQACPSVAWDEADGDISAEPGKAVAGVESIATMQPRVEVVVWFSSRETARVACYMLMAASRDVPVDHGKVEFDRYLITRAASNEHATFGFQFVMQARVSLPVPLHPIPVTTEVIVQGHTFIVKTSDGDEDHSDDVSVASGSRPIP